jgi:sulfate/thiosulfate-binding protein
MRMCNTIKQIGLTWFIVPIGSCGSNGLPCRANHLCHQPPNSLTGHPRSLQLWSDRVSGTGHHAVDPCASTSVSAGRARSLLDSGILAVGDRIGHCVKSAWLNIFALFLVTAAVAVLIAGNRAGDPAHHLLNVSYDPTRELYLDLDRTFVADYERQSNQRLTIRQSHSGSSRQAHDVADGKIEADVVTLALPSDIDFLVRRGLVAANWEDRLPNHAEPYISTIVFVVRRGNPLRIHDWPDLIRPRVTVVTPNPKTSGNGKLGVLSAWGSVIARGGDDAAAAVFLKELFHHVIVLGEGARDASQSFASDEIGDVHLTWENEALREVSESAGKLELVYPPVSIRAEPSVAWVDANVGRHGTTAVAEAYLRYLFTAPAQEIIAEHGYRPLDAAVLRQHREHLPDLTLFPITLLGADWSEVQRRFFDEDGIYDRTVDSVGPDSSSSQGK